MSLTADRLILFLRDALRVEGEVTPESALFTSGALDSVAMMNLIAFVEEQAAIQVRADQVTLENFDTPGRIVAFANAAAA
ncbi:acyl carrier protein [Amaricoccus solimangrovi]|uniref:Acyl carrier protein n=1 Tax=Amaricoccus solimangrovi TaxID=2589815 RepID=A0A501X0E3_9RHOB|nr:acyl carrier protein [Amaricoccus solimangrovi]TPE53101.1 acyl carrier protein [Amaricoccus solimangrovi]